MPENPYLASSLIQALRDEGMIPPSDLTATTRKLLGFLNRSQRVAITDLLQSAREEYQYATQDITLTSSRTYPIPTRSVVSGLAMVLHIGSGDSNTNGRPLNKIQPDQVHAHRMARVGAAYFLDGNNLELTHELSGTLRLKYIRRLNVIVPASECGEVDSINTGTKTVTLVSVPSDFSSTETYDFVQGQPQFNLLGESLTATLSGSDLVFDDALPDDLAEGDYVALAGCTPICQAPVELHDVLTQDALTTYLQATGDPKAAVAEQQLAKVRGAALSLISPRVQAPSEVLVRYGGPGWRRGWPYGRRGGQ